MKETGPAAGAAPGEQGGKQPVRLHWLAALAVLSLLAALYMVFVYAPEERTMGLVQKIFYIHVALAWNAYLAFFGVLLGGLAYLVRRRWQWDAAAASAAELGVLFTVLTLVTGMLWARPVWNAWWTWDPRLTTTLIMGFMYVAYLLIRAAVDDEERRARVAAVFGTVAFLNVPLVHFSARWWRGLHPVVLDSGPTANMDPRMAVALLAMALAVTLVHAWLWMQRFQLELLEARMRRLRARWRPETE